MAFLRKILVTLLLTSLLAAPATGAIVRKLCCCESEPTAGSCCKASAGSCCATSTEEVSGCCQSSKMTLGCQAGAAGDCCFVCSDCEPAPSNQSRPVSVENPLEILLYVASSIDWDTPVQFSPETAFDHSLPADPGPPIRVRFAVWLI